MPRVVQVYQDDKVSLELWGHRARRGCRGSWAKRVNQESLEEMGCLAKKEYLDYQESRALLDLQATGA